jgi:uncharacterized protein GlcG (DUF336 family)
MFLNVIGHGTATTRQRVTEGRGRGSRQTLGPMEALTLDIAQAVAQAALRYAREKKLLPLGVAILDARGALKCYAAEEHSSLHRSAIAIGKASGALAMGLGSRTLAKRARDTPAFYAALAAVIPGGVLPAPGGVLVRSAEGTLLGAVGISGDVSDNDEAAALAAIEAVGLIGDAGSD